MIRARLRMALVFNSTFLNMTERRTLKLVLIGSLFLILFFQLIGPGGSARLSTLTRAAVEVEGTEDNDRRAMAILRQHCLQCHGADGMGGLDLRRQESAARGGGRGVVIRPGRADESLLYQFLIGKASPRMPLGGELQAAEIEILRRWIDEGAKWPEVLTAEPPAADRDQLQTMAQRKITAEHRRYWAFQTPIAPPVPEIASDRSISNPIDAFILAGLGRQGLTFSPLADRRTLIRRVTFDLTGLPPTPEEIDAFLSDRAPDAYERVVRRLLDSPRYGERWAQHWLDVVRFGETNGFELDNDREQAWRYRDYVVASLNEDKPYDRFIREQIAGDELAPEEFEMRVATGFLRAGPQHVVAGNQDLAVNRQEWLTEVMFGVGNGLLGLTVGCARCHDHKFDPILQADFYRLQAFFAASDNVDYQRPAPEAEAALKAAQAAHQEKLKPIREQIAAIEKPYVERLKREKKEKLERSEPVFAAALAKPSEQRTELEKQQAKDAQRMLNVSWDEILAILTPEDRTRRAGLRQQMHRINLFTPEPLPKALAVSDSISPIPAMHLLKAGDPHRPGQEVRPGFLTALLPPGADWDAEVRPVVKGDFKSTGRKLALANWLAHPDHPLTSRVMVNRLWHYHFGRGIVPTPNDFGRNGQPPTHPELLDWLAVEFVKSGWSLKKMHFLMVTSRTYRQSSEVDPRQVARDPGNQWFWRMNRQRLDAEALRDTTLAVAGNLTEQIGGPSIRVPLEPEVYDTIFTEAEPDNLWPVHPDQRQHWRRSLYLIRKRNVRLPMLVAFDSPDMMSSCGARSSSVHALQSLTLLNSDFMLTQSRLFAGRLLREAGGDRERAIERLHTLALGRPPLAVERRLAREFLASQTRIIAERLRRGETVATVAGLSPTVPAAEAAAWVDLCLATMNLNEFLYLR
jgi:mono/diheme cytochrome c family protein